MLNDHCHRVSTHLQSINIIIIIIIMISLLFEPYNLRNVSRNIEPVLNSVCCIEN